MDNKNKVLMEWTINSFAWGVVCLLMYKFSLMANTLLFREELLLETMNKFDFAYLIPIFFSNFLFILGLWMFLFSIREIIKISSGVLEESILDVLLGNEVYTLPDYLENLFLSIVCLGVNTLVDLGISSLVLKLYQTMLLGKIYSSLIIILLLVLMMALFIEGVAMFMYAVFGYDVKQRLKDTYYKICEKFGGIL